MTKSPTPCTQLIGKFKKIFFQFHITSLKNFYDKGEEYATEVENIRDDYIATSDALYQLITDWEEKYNTLIKLQSKSKRNQKKEVIIAKLRLARVDFVHLMIKLAA